MATTSIEAIRRITIQAQEKGLDEVAAKLDKVAKAQEGIVASSTSVTQSSGSTEQAFKKVERQLDPTVVAYERYASAVKAISDQLAQTGNQQRATELFGLAEQRLIKATGAATGFSQAAAGIAAGVAPARHEMQNFMAQVQDIGVGLVGGQSPFTVMAQQIPQLASAVAASNASLKDFVMTAVTGAARFAVAWGPAIGGVTLALGGLALAWNNVNEKREAMLAVSGGKGRLLGLNPDDVDKMASRARPPGVSSGESREGVLEGVRAGIAPETIVKLVEVSKLYAATLNTELLPAQKELMAAFVDPAKGMEQLEQKLNLNLTPAFKDLILSMQAAGLTVQAQQLLIEAMTPALLTNAQAVTLNAEAWALIKSGAAAAGSGFGDFMIQLVTLNGFISQFIVSTAGLFQGLGNIATSAYAAVAGVDASTLSFGNAAAAAEALRRANEQAFYTVNQANEAYTRKLAVMQAVTVEDRAAATQAQVLGDLLAKGTNDIVANAEALRRGNEVRDEANATSAKTVANQQIEIEINNKIIGAYQMQSSQLEVVIAKLKEEQAIRQAGLNILSEDSQKRIENAGRIAAQTKEISELSAQQSRAPVAASASAARSGSTGGSAMAIVDQVLGGTYGGGGDKASVAEANAILAKTGWGVAEALGGLKEKVENMTKGGVIDRWQASIEKAADAMIRIQSDATLSAREAAQQIRDVRPGMTASGTVDRISAAYEQAAADETRVREDSTLTLREQQTQLREVNDKLNQTVGAVENFRQAVQTTSDGMSTSFAAGSDKPLSERGGFTSPRRLTWMEYSDRALRQNDKAAEVQKQVDDAARAGQQRQLQIASSTIQDQITALNDQKSAIQENTDALEKATTARREQLDKEISKLEKALNPSRPDPYAERNPDYFYRFGTQAFKENDPMQALLTAAEAERDGLDAQLDQQKKSVDLQQKAIDEQIKGFEAQAKQLDRAGNLLSSGVDLSAQEVSGLQAILAAIGALGDFARLQSANVAQTLTAQQAAAKAAGDPASEFAGTREYGLEQIRRGTAYQPITPQIYGFQQGIKSSSGFFASGGYIPPGSWGVAGESGPEVITRKRAVAGPATVTPIVAGGSRPIVVNQTFVSQGGARELRASRGEIAQRSSSEMRRSLGAR